MVPRPLGRTGLQVTPIGFGAFKIGRNLNAKYPDGYQLPTDSESTQLLNTVLDLGVNFIDTAPAYGLSEQRIGHAIASRRSEFVLSTKVGESFDQGHSTFDFTSDAIQSSIERSVKQLKTDTLDIVFVHSDGRDLHIMDQTETIPTLFELKSKGTIRAIGMSPKTPEGAHASLAWADVIMVEHNLNCRVNESVISKAHKKGVGVIVKKGMGSGWLDPRRSIRFVLSTEGVDALTIGSLNIDHLKQNIESAEDSLAPAQQ